MLTESQQYSTISLFGMLLTSGNADEAESYARSLAQDNLDESRPGTALAPGTGAAEGQPSTSGRQHAEQVDDLYKVSFGLFEDCVCVCKCVSMYRCVCLTQLCIYAHRGWGALLSYHAACLCLPPLGSTPRSAWCCSNPAQLFLPPSLPPLQPHPLSVELAVFREATSTGHSTKLPPPVITVIFQYLPALRVVTAHCANAPDNALLKALFPQVCVCACVLLLHPCMGTAHCANAPDNALLKELFPQVRLKSITSAVFPHIVIGYCFGSCVLVLALHTA